MSALARGLFHLAAVFGVLSDGSTHLFHAAGHLLDSSCLFAGALRNDAGRRSHLGSCGAHRASAHADFADHFVELAGHLGHGTEQAAELIAAIYVDGLGQVARTDVLHDFEHVLNRLGNAAGDHQRDNYAGENGYYRENQQRGGCGLGNFYDRWNQYFRVAVCQLSGEILHPVSLIFEFINRGVALLWSVQLAGLNHAEHFGVPAFIDVHILSHGAKCGLVVRRKLCLVQFSKNIAKFLALRIPFGGVLSSYLRFIDVEKGVLFEPAQFQRCCLRPSEKCHQLGVSFKDFHGLARNRFNSPIATKAHGDKKYND